MPLPSGGPTQMPMAQIACRGGGRHGYPAIITTCTSIPAAVICCENALTFSCTATLSSSMLPEVSTPQTMSTGIFSICTPWLMLSHAASGLASLRGPLSGSIPLPPMPPSAPTPPAPPGPAPDAPNPPPLPAAPLLPAYTVVGGAVSLALQAIANPRADPIKVTIAVLYISPRLLRAGQRMFLASCRTVGIKPGPAVSTCSRTGC
jgi:hypothetical protein